MRNSEINIPLPRLLNSSGGTERQIHPTNVSINLAIEPLSDATMTLPQGESLPARGYVELFTVMGSAGIYRVRSPQDAYGVVTTTAELEHAIVEVGDYLVKANISQMMSASTAISTIFGHYGGSKWQLGSTTAIGSGQVAVEVNYGRVLDALLSVLDQKPDCMMSFDFSTSPWTVNFVAKGTTVSAEGRLARNVNYAKVTYDDTELCTRVYYEKQSTTDSTSGIDTSGIPTFSASKNYSKQTYVIYSGDNKIYYLPNGHVAGTTWANTTKTLQNDIPTTTWAYVDADTASTYGRIEKSISVGSDYTASEALKVAQEYLSKHKEPRVSVEISAEELSHVTGESFDSFDVGKLYRLALADFNITIEKHVTGLSFPNVYGTPEKITVRLAQEEDTAINFLHDMDAKGGTDGGSGGISEVGSGSGKSNFQRVKDYWTKLEQDAYHFNLIAAHVDDMDRILQQAGLYIDADGVVVYAQDNVNNIGSHFQVDADKIEALVEKTGVDYLTTGETLYGKLTVEAGKISQIVTNVGADGTVTSASIVAAINDTTGQGEVHIDADHVYINAGQSSESNVVTVIGGKTSLNEVESTFFNTTYLNSAIGQIAVLSVAALASAGGISATGFVSGDSLEGNSILLNGHSFTDCVVDYSESSGTVTLTWASGRTENFNSAASVTEQSSSSWSNGVKTITLTNGNTINVSIPASSGTTWTNTTGNTWRADLSIGGVTRYSTTKDFSSIANGVTLSQGSWSNGALVVTASNGKTTTVSLPASSGTTWTNTTGNTWRADLSIGGTTRYSTTKDFTSVYNAGWNACRNAMIESQYWWTGYTGTESKVMISGVGEQWVISPYQSANHYRYTVPNAK